MVRLARRLRNGEYYHVVTRGNDRRRLFKTPGDYRFFLETAVKYQRKFDIGIIHYCLMPNHCHLLVRADTAPELPKFMQALLQVYGIYFRRKYHSTGFLFQNRYKSKLIEDQIHLLECGRYIERNPLRAKLVDNLDTYPWSSYSFYGMGKFNPLIKYCNPIYVYLGDTPEYRREFYRNLFNEGRLYEALTDVEFKLA